MRGAAMLLSVLLLAACGVDGEPQQPEPTDGQRAVQVTGDARVGMSVGQSGTRGFGSVSLHNGPVTLSVGF